MNSSDDINKMMKVIDEFIMDFQSDTKTIDREIGRTRYVKKGNDGQTESRGTLSDNLSSSIRLYEEYKNSQNIHRIHYIKECYTWITKARSIGAIKTSDKIIQELQMYKQKFKELESDLNDEYSTIEELRDIRSKLEEKIKLYETMYPALKKLGSTKRNIVENK